MFNRFITNQLAYVLPSLSAYLSYRDWTKTRRPNRPRREEACYTSAKRSTMQVNHQNIAMYHWGSGPKVLLLHGWNGRASQFYQIIENLVDSGYEVVSFDQPGFGDSDGEHSGLLPIKDVVSYLGKEYGPFESIVAHSFGWLVAINSKPTEITRSLVGIAPPANFNWLIDGYGFLSSLSQPAISALKIFVKNKYNISNLDEISIANLGPLINVPGLIVYDKTDDKIPRTQIDEILDNWPTSSLVLTEGLGHTRLLYDKTVAKKISRFITELRNENN